MLWPLSVVLVANTNGRLAIPALAGLLVIRNVACNCMVTYIIVTNMVTKLQTRAAKNDTLPPALTTVITAVCIIYR